MNKEIIFDLSGFSKFNISKTEYNKFITKTKNNIYICLKKTKSKQVFLELVDLKEIKECLVYVFFVFEDNIYFKMANLKFNRKLTKSYLLKDKLILNQILLKLDDIDYDMNPSAHNPYGIYKFK
jgi:hypothetical protein